MLFKATRICRFPIVVAEEATLSMPEYQALARNRAGAVVVELNLETAESRGQSRATKSHRKEIKSTLGATNKSRRNTLWRGTCSHLRTFCHPSAKGDATPCRRTQSFQCRLRHSAHAAARHSSPHRFDDPSPCLLRFTLAEETFFRSIFNISAGMPS